VAVDPAWARDQFAHALVARLATVGPDGQPHVVPIVFALRDPSLYTAVDAKPKRGSDLARLRNIAHEPRVSLLVDHYNDDWRQLWWARADGVARVLDIESAEGELARRLLEDRYPQYSSLPPSPGPVIAIDVTRWSGWSGAG
jgi:PPOX class probable F420-dependent enzyme